MLINFTADIYICVTHWTKSLKLFSLFWQTKKKTRWNRRLTFVESGDAGLEDSKNKKNPDDFKHIWVNVLHFIEPRDYFHYLI